MKKLPEVKESEFYTLQDIVKNKMFPWATSFWSVRNIVAKDRDSKNILKATITGEGKAKKYHFKGANIIRFVNGVGEGKIQL